MNKLYIVLALCAPITFNAFSMDIDRATAKATKRTAAAETAAAWAAERAQARLDVQNNTPNAIAIRNATNQRLDVINQRLADILLAKDVAPITVSLEKATNERDTAIERLAIVAYFNNGAPRFGQRVAQRVNALIAAPKPLSEAQEDQLYAFLGLIALAKAAAVDVDAQLHDYDALNAAEEAIRKAQGEE